jgi:hypothetical protein
MLAFSKFWTTTIFYCLHYNQKNFQIKFKIPYHNPRKAPFLHALCNPHSAIKKKPIHITIWPEIPYSHGCLIFSENPQPIKTRRSARERKHCDETVNNEQFWTSSRFTLIYRESLEQFLLGKTARRPPPNPRDQNSRELIDRDMVLWCLLGFRDG